VSKNSQTFALELMEESNDHMNSMFGSDSDEDDCLEQKSVATHRLFAYEMHMDNMGGGRGVFADVALGPGCLISAEKPFIDWSSKTDFCDVDDLATVILSLLRSPNAVTSSKQLYPSSIGECVESNYLMCTMEVTCRLYPR
jgi:hypothetical protein